MSPKKYKEIINGIVREFDNLPLKNIRKPRVGVVGEILVKFHPAANNDIFSTIEREGAECVVPDLLDFFLYSSISGIYQNTYLDYSFKKRFFAKLGIWVMERYRRPIKKALNKSKRFTSPESIYRLADSVDGILQLGNVTGEGWFLTAEMIRRPDRKSVV